MPKLTPAIGVRSALASWVAPPGANVDAMVSVIVWTPDWIRPLMFR